MASIRRRELLLAAPAAGWARLRAQSSIAVDVRLVQVTFSVRDAAGAIVPNLTADDFEVFENGERQRLSRFSHGSDQALRLGVLADGSGSQSRFIESHRQDLTDFLESALTSADGAFVLGFGNTLRLVCDFANDAEAMMSRLDFYRDHAGRLPKLGPDEDRDGGTALFDAIYYSIREKLNQSDGGRRALLILSDGGDNSSGHHLLDAIEIAQSADVRVFGVWYSGDEKDELEVRDRYGLRVLTRLSQDSGGELFEASGESLREQFHRISEDLRSSYEAAYYSTQAASDGRFRQVEIRPKDASLRVRARPGYYAR